MKAILDIYVWKAFPWYKEVFNPMIFDPYNYSLKIWESIETSTPKVGAHFGMWGFIPSHFPTLLGAWDATPKILSWPTLLQTLVLVMNPRLGLRQHVSYAFNYLALLQCNLVEHPIMNIWEDSDTLRFLQHGDYPPQVTSSHQNHIQQWSKHYSWRYGKG